MEWGASVCPPLSPSTLSPETTALLNVVPEHSGSQASPPSGEMQSSFMGEGPSPHGKTAEAAP